MSGEAGTVYGFQAVDLDSGSVVSEMTKIGFTARHVASRRAEMQRSLGAAAFFDLVVRFGVPVEDARVERAVHRRLRRQGLGVRTPSAQEWFRIGPADAERIVREVAADPHLVEAELGAPDPEQGGRRSAARMPGHGTPKSMAATPKRIAALEAVRAAAAAGGSPSDFAGGRWGAAAVALAAEEGIGKPAALVLLQEMFAR